MAAMRNVSPNRAVRNAADRFHRRPRAKARQIPGPEQRLPIGALLQSFVRYAHCLPPDARRLLTTAELPPAMERVAGCLDPQRQTWLAWTDDARTWLVVAAPEPLLGPGPDPILRIFFYDEDARFVASGAWSMHADGTWTLWAP